MKNLIKLLVIVAIVAAIGFSVVGCKDDDGGGDELGLYISNIHTGGNNYMVKF